MRRLLSAFVALFLSASGAYAADNWSTIFAPSKFSLSNGNLTATATQHNFVDTIIGIISHTTGRFYFEMQVGSTADLVWGLTVAGQSNNTQLYFGDGSTHRGVAFREQDGSGGTPRWRINNTETADGGMPTPGATTWLGFAVDLTAGYILVRQTAAPTVWYGNNSNLGDPASIATHGFNISSVTGPALFLAFTSIQNGIDEVVTMNAGASSFQAAAPSGYAPWGIADNPTAGNPVHAQPF